MAFDKLCVDAVFTDPDVNTSKAWETLAGLQRNEAVAYSTGGVPWLAGQVLQVTDLIQNPDRARGKYKRVDLLAARPAQPGDTGPYVLALQDSPVDGYEVSVLLVGHIRADFSGAGVGETWNPGDLLYIDTSGALTNNPIKLDANGAAVMQVVSATGGLFFGSGTNAALIDSKMRWRGNWVNGETYRKNDVVLDAPWLMIANTETQDRPGVVNIGAEFYDLGDTPNWSTPTHTGEVWSGVRYNVGDNPVKIVGYQFWVPEVGANIGYRLLIRVYPTGSTQDAVITVIDIDPQTAGQWVTAEVIHQFLAPNTTAEIALVALNSASDTTITGTWVKGAPANNNTTDPGSGNWGTRSNVENIRISYTDDNGGDRTAELQAIVAGSTIKFVSDVIPAQTQEWLINATGTDFGTHITFEAVTYLGDGPAGAVPEGDASTMTAIIPVPDPTQYVTEVGASWSPLPAGTTAEGLLIFDGAGQASATDTFGVRALWQEVSASPDYDIMSTWDTVAGGGGSSGGAATFLQLTDTPVGYGAVGQVPAVNATQDGLIWSNGGGTGGANTTLELTDTPSSYGLQGQYLAMNLARDALIWTNPTDVTGYLPKTAGVTHPLTGPLYINTTGNLGLKITDTSTSNLSPWFEMVAKRGDANTWTTFSAKTVLAAQRTDDMVPTDKHLGGVIFAGNHTDGTEANIAASASIWGISDGPFNGLLDMPTAFVIRTGTEGSAISASGVTATFGTERLRVTSMGLVGIGTPNPQATLHVDGGARFDIDGNEAAILEPAGPDVTSAHTILTVEKGDERYAQLAEQTFRDLLVDVENLRRRVMMLEDIING